MLNRKALSALFIGMAITWSSWALVAQSYTFGGSTTLGPIMYAAIEDFQKSNAGVKISYEATGSSAGLKAIKAKEISLSGSSADFSPSELTGLKSQVIAYDGLSVAVNKSVKIVNLSLNDLAKIYHGDITNWKQVGGADAPIVVINRDESSGTFVAFWEIVLQKNYGKAINYTKNAIVTRDNGELAAKIASTPNSIGYIGFPFVEEVVKAGGKSVSIDGVKDSVANVMNKKYPLVRPLFVLTPSTLAQGSIEQKFLDFLLSARGQAIVKSVGYIPRGK